MSRPISGACTICTEYFTLIHWHHTVPRAVGGEDSLQIPLCANCHNVLHAHANAVLANIKNGRRIKRRYWTSETQELNAKPYVTIIVESTLSFELRSEGYNKEWTVSVKVPDRLYQSLRMFKSDTTGLGSMEQALLLCLAEALNNKGYYETDSSLTKTNKGRTKNPSTTLW